MIKNYIHSISNKYSTGITTEHSFRGDLQNLLESIFPENLTVINEPKRQTCGAPDYIVEKKGGIPIGFIEAKDIGDKDLDGLKKTGNKEQFDRYKASLNNIIFTDYMNFHFYENGELRTKVKIAEIEGNRVKPLPENFKEFENLINNFIIHVGHTIKSPKTLAEMMAGKAKLLASIAEKALTSDEDSHEDSTLKEQMEAFKDILIHDITPKSFADVYAQTIAYGMFAARLNDPTLPTFSRQEAAELITKSNPFLRRLFGYIAGPEIDDRIKWVVDSLIDVFLHCNVKEILKNYGRSTKMENPIIHFYETFLGEYDPKLKKSRGVWYTPAPVVNFIVRAVDDVLKQEFGLSQGLADTSKTTIKVEATGTSIQKGKGKGNKIIEEKEVHKVQMLDPATGTGTFLSEVVKHIHKKFEGQDGIWSNYVESHLLPRLNGFEILMASYAMAHLQLYLLLQETGYKPQSTQRLRVYLTNSLEESHPDTGTLFANWLSNEANEANYIKRDTPVMCIIGNPPYSGESSNKGEWIMSLMDDYKKEPNSTERLNERNPKWINDDYVKFLRYGQHFIEKNGTGVLAFINPHGFLDNPTFRGMRWNLLKTYDKIYTIDLHGNSRKNEISPDGSIDQNVFDIMQGVSINLLIKTGKKKDDELGKVFHFDLYGKRDSKYNFLTENSIKSIIFDEVKNLTPDYYFIPKNYNVLIDYELGFSINEMFNIKSSGIKTSNDAFLVSFDKEKLIENVKSKFNVDINESLIKKYNYKPFVEKLIYYDDNLIGRSRKEFMSNFFDKENYGISIMRNLVNTDSFSSILITKNLLDINFYGFQTYSLPLYIYKNKTDQQSLLNENIRTPNLNMEIVNEIAEGLGLEFVTEKEEGNVCLANNKDVRSEYRTTFAPIDLLDYIYAVLHSPTYRETYKEFLKIDFPRVPYPKDSNTFWQLVQIGGELRQIHLLESPTTEKYITQYPEDGDNIVTKPTYKNGSVYINDTQYFANVPEVAWNFYIGGYQPAQKWLKDRKDRELSTDDIFHYQKIIVALSETDRIMKEIDKIEI